MKIPWLIAGVLCALCTVVLAFMLWFSMDFAQNLKRPDVHPQTKNTPGPPAKPAKPSLVGLKEVFVNVLSRKTDDTHYLRFKLELEVFDEPARALIEQRQPLLKHTLITASRQMDFELLKTLPGKLYFKEVLVSRMNESLNLPAVREAHFSAFNLQ